jgi:hypothetical protein
MSFQRICALPTMSEDRIEDCSVMFAKLMRCADAMGSKRRGKSREKSGVIEDDGD